MHDWAPGDRTEPTRAVCLWQILVLPCRSMYYQTLGTESRQSCLQPAPSNICTHIVQGNIHTERQPIGRPSFDRKNNDMNRGIVTALPAALHNSIALNTAIVSVTLSRCACSKQGSRHSGRSCCSLRPSSEPSRSKMAPWHVSPTEALEQASNFSR